jgi:hypothetical protein
VKGALPVAINAASTYSESKIRVTMDAVGWDFKS